MAKRKSKKVATASPAATSEVAPQTASQATSDDKDGPASGVGSLHQNSDVGGLQQIYREGREAMKRINAAQVRDFSDWKKVMRLLDAARTEAMTSAGTNQPIGGAYCKIFGNILKREGLGTDELDSATRNNLLDISKHLTEIEEWLGPLDVHRRRKWNSPSAILRNWKKTEAGRNTLAKDKRQRQKKQLLAQAELRKENERLNARLEEVEQERDSAKAALDQTGLVESWRGLVPQLALKALVRDGEIKIEDLGDLTYEEVTKLADRIDELANEREGAKRRSVKSGNGDSA